MKNFSKYVNDFLLTITLAYLIPIVHFPVINHMYDYYITKDNITGIYRFVWIYDGLIAVFIILST